MLKHPNSSLIPSAWQSIGSVTRSSMDPPSCEDKGELLVKWIGHLRRHVIRTELWSQMICSLSPSHFLGWGPWHPWWWWSCPFISPQSILHLLSEPEKESFLGCVKDLGAGKVIMLLGVGGRGHCSPPQHATNTPPTWWFWWSVAMLH